MSPWHRASRDRAINPDSHVCKVSLSTLTDAVLILEGLAALLDRGPDTAHHRHPDDTPGHNHTSANPAAATASYIRATAAALSAGDHHTHLTHTRDRHHRDWAGELSQLTDRTSEDHRHMTA